MVYIWKEEWVGFVLRGYYTKAIYTQLVAEVELIASLCVYGDDILVLFFKNGGVFLMMAMIETYFLWFLVYSFVGWVFETIVCSVAQKRFVIRGFLNGPYCPIYGFGGIFNLLLLGKINNPFLIFLAAFFLTGILEYITSWGLEKLFHARWWDYSDKKFNIKGRVYLKGGLTFALLSLLQLKFLQPLVATYTAMVSANIRSFIALILLIGFLVDVVYTVTKLAELNQLLRNTPLLLGETAVKKLYEKINGKYYKINSQIKRTIKSFPRLKSVHYNDFLDEVKEYIRNRKKKDKESDEESTP